MGFEIQQPRVCCQFLGHRNYSHHVYVHESCIQLILTKSKCQKLSHCGRCNASVLVDMPKSPTFVLTWSNLVLKMLNLKKKVCCILKKMKFKMTKIATFTNQDRTIKV